MIKCPYCNKQVSLDPMNNENEKWIQCPHCGGFFRNVNFNESKPVRYVG